MGSPPVVLAIDFGGTKTAIAVCDLAGNPLASVTAGDGQGAAVAGPGRPRAPEVFRAGVRAARELLAATAPGRELAAVGASTFGIPFEDRVELAPAIDGWEDLAFGRELRAAFAGVPVRMATDAKAAASAETRWGALRGCDPGVYLNLGTGLSAALVIGGQVVSGRDGGAGEIGYNLRAIADVGLALGERVPLEDVASGQGLARQARALAGRAAAGPLTAAGVFRAAPHDPALTGLLDATITELAYHLVNLAICLNPVRIAAGGGLVRSWDRLGPPLTAALAAGTPFPPELVTARFPYDAPLRGAAALAADAAAALPNRLGNPAQPDTLTEGLPQ
ncbi:MAG: ROK family protein [Gemmatimonadota bacterium]